MSTSMPSMKRSPSAPPTSSDAAPNVGFSTHVRFAQKSSGCTSASMLPMSSTIASLIGCRSSRPILWTRSSCARSTVARINSRPGFASRLLLRYERAQSFAVSMMPSTRFFVRAVSRRLATTRAALSSASQRLHLSGRIELLEIEPHRVVEGGPGPAIARRQRRRLDLRAHLEPGLRDVEAEILLHVLALYESRETHG